ncbi:hypothetical protein [Amphritea sp. HPY]|uniref:hypothetical protein n=1 Tax=Amphritea sp. HPY TaxID=3421652 RepID=UPI003D7E3AA5
MKESDWKKFKKIKEAALDKCCQEALIEYQKSISDDSASHHQRFLNVYELVHDTNKELAQIFDDQSRSKAVIQMLLMRRRGLVPDESIAIFSEEFQQSSDPDFFL